MFEKYSNIKFQENPFSGSLVVPCEQTNRQTDGWIGMAKPVVAFRNFPKAPKKRRLINNHITRKFTLSLIYLSRRDTFRHKAPYTVVRYLNNFPEIITPY